MLSVVFAESADNFAHLVRFYAPDADRLLDVTHGAGTLTKRCPIPVLGVDRDPGSKASVICDSCALPFRDDSFAAAVFDPPYLYGSHAMHMGPIGKKTWSTLRSTWDVPADLVRTARGIAAELYRVCQGEATVFCKVMDSRFKGKLIRNHDIVADAFEERGFTLIDQIVYVRTVTGSFVNAVSAQSAHGYFLVLRKRTAQQGLRFEMPA